MQQSDSALRFPVVPDPAKTPGDTLEVTAADICTPGYSKKVRNVPIEVKRQVYASYGIRTHQPGEYEVDHLISLELGGSNSIRNLWPQSFRTSPWNACVKDALENELHRRVCAGTIDLAKAQRIIAQNWVIGLSYLREPESTAHPGPATSSHSPPPQGSAASRKQRRQCHDGATHAREIRSSRPSSRARTIAQIGWDGADRAAALRRRLRYAHSHARRSSEATHRPRRSGKVRAVRQSSEAIVFDLESGSALQFPLAEATSCVMLRDAKGALEYAD